MCQFTKSISWLIKLYEVMNLVIYILWTDRYVAAYGYGKVETEGGLNRRATELRVSSGSKYY